MNVQVVGYRAEYSAAFATLNYHWIEQYFQVEEEDVKALEDPTGYALNPGGNIFFVLVDDEVVGCAAIVPKEPGVFELAKMAVRPSHQGRGLSHLLMDACIGFAKNAGAQEVMLLTNSVLTPAVTLYEAAGFVASPTINDHRYARGNLEMHLRLAPAQTNPSV
ncbi:MAG: GNAT family N-acetyltransferase [Proteobacteria bacterium]|nr:GNAT family N-acetyltransferase [Pseudomonadota bacterium]